MPIDYKKYPKNWKWLSKQVIERARDCCELCHAPNRKHIYRNWIGKWWYQEMQGYDKLVRIVLTVHHINFNLADNHPLNLIALCQRCHLRLDIREKLRKRKEVQQCD